MKRYIRFLSLTLAVSCLLSCLPQEVIFEEGVGDIVEIYNFHSTRTASQTYASRNLKELIDSTGEYVYDIVTDTSFEFPVVVNYTGLSGAPGDVTVELAVDEAIADVVGRQTGLDYAVLPSSAYTLSGSSVTIPKGVNRAEYIVKVNASQLESGKVYVLGIKITGASAGTISGNFSSGGFYFEAL
ncbi:MAG: DUF1735 domain-containing protein [Tannerella sp.]|nr:DUF1735 domain-containing protein [Tannerella sp.]